MKPEGTLCTLVCCFGAESGPRERAEFNDRPYLFVIAPGKGRTAQHGHTVRTPGEARRNGAPSVRGREHGDDEHGAHGGVRSRPAQVTPRGTGVRLRTGPGEARARRGPGGTVCAGRARRLVNTAARHASCRPGRGSRLRGGPGHHARRPAPAASGVADRRTARALSTHCEGFRPLPTRTSVPLTARTSAPPRRSARARRAAHPPGTGCRPRRNP